MAVPLRVLIVDDSQDDADLVIEEFRRGGYDEMAERVQTAEAVRAALEEAEWDVIISDYSMPGFTGLDALKIVREKEIETPLILVSGTIGEEVAVEAIRAGADDYLMKDRLVRLVPAIESAMEHARARRERRRAEAERENALRDLSERVKELKCLYSLSILVAEPAESIDELLRVAVDLIPPGWQYPEITCARITFEGREFASPNFRETRWKQSAEIIVSEESAGSLMVCYLEEPLALEAEPLLKEKRDLIDDIARQLGVMIERMQADRKIRESEINYRTLVNNLPQKVFLKDRNSVYVSCNDNYARDLKIRPEEIKGRTNYEFHPREVAEKYRTDDKRLMDSGESEDLEEKYVVDGQEIWVHTVKTPVKDDKGNVIGILGIFWDITERRQLEEQLRQSQKMEAAGRLAGGVAHDFNNMLGIIIGNTDLALMETEPSTPIYESLEEIMGAAKRSADLTRQLLAFARRQTISPRLLDLNETVAGMLKMLQRLIGEDIDLLWIPGQDLWGVWMDPSQIDQILVNLLVNARQAITGAGKVTLETDNVMLDEAYCRGHAGFIPGEFALLGVTDSGSGMSREVLDHIFEPFFTTRGIGQGTGIGLATVYGIVKQNRGFINVYSESGQGTTFRIYLPRFRGEAAVEPVQTETAAKDLPRGTETILLVEDEEGILSLGQTILVQQGYTVLATSMPAEALTLAEAHPDEIHLLITDVVMPEMNGRALMERLQALRPGLKSLFMSGYTDNVVVRHGILEAGINFIQKPFSVKALAEKVRQVLDKK